MQIDGIRKLNSSINTEVNLKEWGAALHSVFVMGRFFLFVELIVSE
ncbi:MAG: hypothetical protein ACI9CE_002383 [Flavobacterium sp.]|jgi:hypothetical protein